MRLLPIFLVLVLFLGGIIYAVPSFRTKFTGLLKKLGPKASEEQISGFDSNDWACGLGPDGFSKSDFGGSAIGYVSYMVDSREFPDGRMPVASLEKRDDNVGTVGSESYHKLNSVICQYAVPDDTLLDNRPCFSLYANGVK